MQKPQHIRLTDSNTCISFSNVHMGHIITKRIFNQLLCMINSAFKTYGYTMNRTHIDFQNFS